VETQAHGVLVDVLGLGVLLSGPSGIGKSECALELVTRGHRLVSDDVVRIRRDEAGRLVGTAPELIRHYMEITGIGIFHVPDLYGAEAVRGEIEIDLMCRFERWREDRRYERVGLERPTEEILGVAVPILVLPVRPAGSMATLIELAARDHRQRSAGRSGASRLDARVRAGYGRA
jgi:HPr kinase/phosphorylase